MNATDALDLVQFSIWTVIVVAAPAVLPAMVAGVVIALLQALTQVQEVTLTFVPKIMIVFFSTTLAAGFVGSKLLILTNVLYGRIASGF
ncbi:flagellar export apparatus protein FliQ [Zhengella mangrovi]|uniref:Flagellar export apparatus protein FliQ n=1 Tax=Zhengella mangrovi TaxID=1982044 RepID=A0A2G1QJQ9_9HYPH|nr:flagellar biosynthetic protein FliQ [Zhengella mangrovi]PHP65709.1 flagellar export apparatus protein FliQ [Zhengella mangrovi]